MFWGAVWLFRSWVWWGGWWAPWGVHAWQGVHSVPWGGLGRLPPLLGILFTFYFFVPVPPSPSTPLCSVDMADSDSDDGGPPPGFDHFLGGGPAGAPAPAAGAPAPVPRGGSSVDSGYDGHPHGFEMCHVPAQRVPPVRRPDLSVGDGRRGRSVSPVPRPARPRSLPPSLSPSPFPTRPFCYGVDVLLRLARVQAEELRGLRGLQVELGLVRAELQRVQAELQQVQLELAISTVVHLAAVEAVGRREAALRQMRDLMDGIPPFPPPPLPAAAWPAAPAPAPPPPAVLDPAPPAPAEPGPAGPRLARPPPAPAVAAVGAAVGPVPAEPEVAPQ